MKRIGLTLFGAQPILALGGLIVAWCDLIPLSSAGDPTFFGRVLGITAGVLIVSVPICFLGYCLVSLLSRTVRETVGAHKWLDVLWVITTLLVCFSFIGVGHGDPNSRGMRTARTRNELVQISTAIGAYETEYGTLPSTASNRDILEILQGKNERKMVFISLKQSNFNPQGEVLDGWGTPIRISLHDTNHPVIESAGADRMLGSEDDITCQIPP